MAPNDPKLRPSDVPPEPGKWPAICLAALMHLLLLLALIFGVSWHNSSPGPVQAELWTALPAPNRPDPEPTPPVPTPPPEPVKPPPPPPPEPQVTETKPDIAIEQEKKRREQEKLAAEARQREQQKREAEKREQAQKLEEAKREAAADKVAAEKKAAADKLAAEKKAAAEKLAADKKAAAEKKLAAERDQKLREAFRGDTARAAGLEGGREGGTADRNQTGGSGGSPGYADLVRACIKPGVIYSAGSNPPSGNPTAIFRVQLLPTGDQAGPPRLQRSSGVPAFDRAVENGIRRCDPFPRPSSGRFESNIEVQYRMLD